MSFRPLRPSNLNLLLCSKSPPAAGRQKGQQDEQSKGRDQKQSLHSLAYPVYIQPEKYNCYKNEIMVIYMNDPI